MEQAERLMKEINSAMNRITTPELNEGNLINQYRFLQQLRGNERYNTPK